MTSKPDKRTAESDLIFDSLTRIMTDLKYFDIIIIAEWLNQPIISRLFYSEENIELSIYSSVVFLVTDLFRLQQKLFFILTIKS